MGHKELEERTAAILVADDFHVHETYYPYFRLREEGAGVSFVGARVNPDDREAEKT